MQKMGKNATKYIMATIMTTIMITITAAMTCFADDIGSNELSVSDMVYSLYANEKDETARTMAIDAALVLTGCKSPTTTYSDGSKLIKQTTASTLNPGVQAMISLLGDKPIQIGRINEKYAIFLDPDESLSDEKIARNIEDLKAIYSMVQTVKTATAGMNDTETLRYIENYVTSLVPTYCKGTETTIARILENGICDCDGYTGLTYLLGINAGLDIKCIAGRAGSSLHAWNEITINGTVYWHDTTWDKTSGTSRYFLALPESYDSAQLLKSNDLREISTKKTIYN